MLHGPPGLCQLKSALDVVRLNPAALLVKVQDQTYSFPIPIEDAKGTTLFAEFKAITLMCWIRKAIEDKTFQLVKS